MLHMTKGQLGRHGLSRNVSDPIEHRHVLVVHYLNKNPGLNPVLLALFGPVEKVCKTFLHACRLSVKFFQTHRGNVKTNLQTEHDNKEMEMEHSNKKNDYQDAAWFTTLESTANTNAKWPRSFSLAFPNDFYPFLILTWIR